jgi:pimeloyl-ACP methyl ester carboxylesterase
MTSSATEHRWQCRGLTLAGLSWGDPQDKPLLALHGWLDNAASFHYLAPLLKGRYVVAVDLSGHGHSDCRSADATYQIWDDLPQLYEVIDQLGWEKFDLMGHSRGAVIANILANTLPESIEHLIMLDALIPPPAPEQGFGGQLRKFIDDRARSLGRPNRVFSSVEQAARRRELQGLSAAAARLIVERNLVPCSEGYTWSTDPRLHGASAVKMSAANIESLLKGLSMPVLLLLADAGLGGGNAFATKAAESIADLRLECIEGGHHFHMEENVGQVAECIDNFINTACRSAA